MSGELVALPGSAMDTFIASIARPAPDGPVVIGGLAVMCRVGGDHRPTLDVDSAFDNDTQTPTTEPVKDFETRAGYLFCMSASRKGSPTSSNDAPVE